MAVCSYQDLLDNANCYTGYPPHILLVLEVQLLCNLLDKIVNAGATTCDVDELLSQSSCFASLPDYILQAVKLQLLCEISSAL
jgi:hypothetical protein